MENITNPHIPPSICEDDFEFGRLTPGSYSLRDLAAALVSYVEKIYSEGQEPTPRQKKAMERMRDHGYWNFGNPKNHSDLKKFFDIFNDTYFNGLLTGYCTLAFQKTFWISKRFVPLTCFTYPHFKENNRDPRCEEGCRQSLKTETSGGYHYAWSISAKAIEAANPNLDLLRLEFMASDITWGGRTPTFVEFKELDLDPVKVAEEIKLNRIILEGNRKRPINSVMPIRPLKADTCIQNQWTIDKWDRSFGYRRKWWSHITATPEALYSYKAGKSSDDENTDMINTLTFEANPVYEDRYGGRVGWLSGLGAKNA